LEGISVAHASFSSVAYLCPVFSASLHNVALYCSSDIVFDTSSSKLRTAANYEKYKDHAQKCTNIKNIKNKQNFYKNMLPLHYRFTKTNN